MDVESELRRSLAVYNDPKSVCQLLRALAGSDNARENRHDTILIGAAEMIEAFERIVKGY